MQAIKSNNTTKELSDDQRKAIKDYYQPLLGGVILHAHGIRFCTQSQEFLTRGIYRLIPTCI